MYDSILIPTDGSAAAKTAVHDGLELAAQNDATVHGLYVVEPVPLGGFTAGAEPASSEWDVVEVQRTEGKQALGDLADAATEFDLEVIEAIQHGKPATTILDYVDENDIDAVVMGTHGRSGVGRYIIGSVAEKVVRKCPVPILTVKQTDSA